MLPGLDKSDPSYKGQSGYNAAMLAIYDVWVLKFMTKAVFKVPVARGVDMYRQHIGHRHVDVGPGTGYFIEKADPPRDRRSRSGPQSDRASPREEATRGTASDLRWGTRDGKSRPVVGIQLSGLSGTHCTASVGGGHHGGRDERTSWRSSRPKGVLRRPVARSPEQPLEPARESCERPTGKGACDGVDERPMGCDGSFDVLQGGGCRRRRLCGLLRRGRAAAPLLDAARSEQGSINRARRAPRSRPTLDRRASRRRASATVDPRGGR